MFLRVYASMALVLAFDTLFFVTGSFYELPQYSRILFSDLVGKSTVSVLYAAILTVYLQRFDVPLETPAGFRGQLRELFQVLTYREKYEALKLQATVDGLTGVYNRGFFDSVLTLQAASAVRSGRPLTLMLVDVDHFKSINDTYGHAEGDATLVAIAAAIKAAVRASDVVARYGGEEFAVVLPETPASEGLGLAERIRAAVPLARGPKGAARRITVTIGLATLPDDAADTAGLLECADRRLYAGKRSGRDQVVAA
jgi:diguanylate cyclase (GGDEF)-like protein